MMGLTPKEAQALDAIKVLSKGGVSPSLRMVMGALGSKSIGSTHRLITQLENRGAITRLQADTKTRYRSMVIAGDTDILGLKTSELRRLRDLIERELRRRAW